MRTSSSLSAGHTLLLLLVLSLGVTAVACSDGTDTDTTTTTTPKATVVASTLKEKLSAAGIDATNPPTWEDVEMIWKSKEGQGGGMPVFDAAEPIMSLFTESLGVQCTECHGPAPDYLVSEERKNIVAGMWNEWVHGLRLKDGGLLFCDSCHQGKKEFLPRADSAALASWMDVNFVANLKRVDGKTHACASCHNAPFDGKFLDKWALGQYPSAP